MEDFDESVTNRNVFKACWYRSTMVLHDIHDVLRVVSPFSGVIKSYRENSAQVLTDEVVARFSSYTQGNYR